MKKEIWKPVADWPCYFVSSRGRIKKVSCYTDLRKRVRFVKQIKDGNGYLRITLWRSTRSARKKIKRYFVHVLVAEAFHGARPLGCQVHHRDFNKGNNFSKNLRWILRAKHYALHAASRAANRSYLGDTPLIFKCRKIGLSISQIAAAFKISQRCVCKIIKPKS